jgi:hypothetical protein
MKPEEIRLGYLLVNSPLANTYIGGAMVTDGRGLPIEFRYTEPIQPTKIQQILYGQVLSSYIKREVILETLLKSLDTRFSHLLVEDENLLSYPGKNFVVVRIGETKSSKIGEIGKIQELSPTELLLQVTKEGGPVRLQLPDSTVFTPSSGAGGVATQSPPVAYELLVEAGQTMDIYEPLKRIEKALETICQEAGISQSH